MNENSAHFWEEKYTDQMTPWDLGRATPVFERLVKSGRFPPGKLIVLGAGRGHDARLFARHGFDVTAVDFAAEAVNYMRQNNEANHPVTVIQADIFELPDGFSSQFDYILEYTCYCAINPARRDEYARLAFHLLKPDGLWIALAFPIGSRSGGPPYVIQPDQVVARMAQHGFVLLHRETPPDSAEGREGIEELLVMRRSERERD